VDAGFTYSFLGVGVFGMTVALALAQRPIRLLRAGGRARGALLETEGGMEAGTHGAGHMTYFPSVAFRTARGEEIIFSSPTGGSCKPAAGTQVDVIYDPECPREAEIVSFRTLWFFPSLTAFFTAPFLIIGVSGVVSRF